LGASKASQVTENLKALEVLEKFTPEIYGKINDILGNEPKPAVSVETVLSRAYA
jgi:aryl-alcohol dehydrogenase-like predicted oxidoreductase